MSKRPSLSVYCPERHVKVDKKVMKKFADLAAKELSKNEDGIQLPSIFGRIMIAGFDFMPRNYQYGQEVRHSNAHTEGLTFIPFYMPRYKEYKMKKINPFIYAEMYKVQMYKPYRRALAKQIKEGNYKHFQDYKTYQDVNRGSRIPTEK